MGKKKYVAYVGTYTHGTSKGIQVYDVDVEKEHSQNEAKWKLAMLLIWQYQKTVNICIPLRMRV